jgi:hypothetical protein
LRFLHRTMLHLLLRLKFRPSVLICSWEQLGGTATTERAGGEFASTCCWFCPLWWACRRRVWDENGWLSSIAGSVDRHSLLTDWDVSTSSAYKTIFEVSPSGGSALGTLLANAKVRRCRWLVNPSIRNAM